MTDTPSGELRRATKKAKTISLIAGLITAATPGVYGAWQAAKASLKTKQEEVVRDKQEGDLQKNIASLQGSLEALRKSAVTHKDLVDLVLKLKATAPPARRRPQPAVTAREQELQRKLAALTKRAQAGAQASRKADAVKRAAPRLKPAKQTRQLVQKANGF